LDEDSDGFADQFDLCPQTASGQAVDADGCSTLDSDGDGVKEQQDWCPQTPADAPIDEHGCSTKDTDSDSTTDQLDACPNDPDKIEPGLCGCDVPESRCTWYQTAFPNCGLGAAALMPLTCLGLFFQRNGGRRR
jgi:hypothetical protein